MDTLGTAALIVFGIGLLLVISGFRGRALARADGYRDEPTTQLVLYGPDANERPWARDEELLVANQKEGEVVTSLRATTVGGHFLDNRASC